MSEAPGAIIAELQAVRAEIAAIRTELAGIALRGISVAERAKALGISPRTLRRRIQAKRNERLLAGKL